MDKAAALQRQQQLLRALIALYIRDGQPVGSRTLVQETGLPISSATVRNIMAELEEKGFLKGEKPTLLGMTVLYRPILAEQKRQMKPRS